MTKIPLSSVSLSETTRRGAKAPAKKPAKPKAPARVVPTGLAVRGRRLWLAHHEQVAGERGLVLLEEACRIADRLDGLERILSGRDKVWLRATLDDRVAVMVVDGALVEARQQASVLRQLIAALPLKEAAGDGDDDEAWLDNL